MEQSTNTVNIGDLLVSTSDKLRLTKKSWLIDFSEITQDPIRVQVKSLDKLVKPSKDLRSHLQALFLSAQGKPMANVSIGPVTATVKWVDYKWGKIDLPYLSRTLDTFSRDLNELGTGIGTLTKKIDDLDNDLKSQSTVTSPELKSKETELVNQAELYKRQLRGMENKAERLSGAIKVGKLWLGLENPSTVIPAVSSYCPPCKYVFWGELTESDHRFFGTLTTYLQEKFTSEKDAMSYLKEILRILPEKYYNSSTDRTATIKPLSAPERTLCNKARPPGKEERAQWDMAQARKYQILIWNAYNLGKYIPLGSGEKKIIFPTPPAELLKNKMFLDYMDGLKQTLQLKKIQFTTWTAPRVTPKNEVATVPPPPPVANTVKRSNSTGSLNPQQEKVLEAAGAGIPLQEAYETVMSRTAPVKPASAQPSVPGTVVLSVSARPAPHASKKIEAVVNKKGKNPKKKTVKKPAEPAVPAVKPAKKPAQPVKVQPRKEISEEDRLWVREVFNLQPGQLTPKWAIRALLMDRARAIPDIKSGSLTKETFQTWSKSISKVDLTTLRQKWSSVRKNFKGVPLLSRPSSKREKEYKAAFDEISKERNKLTANEKKAFKLPSFSKTPSKKGTGAKAGASKRPSKDSQEPQGYLGFLQQLVLTLAGRK